MKLKITDDLVLTNLVSIVQTFRKSDNFKSDITATFSNCEEMNELVNDLKNAAFSSITVLDDMGMVKTVMSATSIDSIEKSIYDPANPETTANQEVFVIIRFS